VFHPLHLHTMVNTLLLTRIMLILLISYPCAQPIEPQIVLVNVCCNAMLLTRILLFLFSASLRRPLSLRWCCSTSMTTG
jgi:hypothetical protein